MNEGKRLPTLVTVAASIFCGFCAGAFTTSLTQMRAIAALETDVAHLKARDTAFDARIETLISLVNRVIQQNSELLSALNYERARNEAQRRP